MENTDNKNQEVETPETENKVDEALTHEPLNNNVVDGQPFKVFTSKEDFDRHSAGILNSAKNKAEKELLAMLGLKPDEKDKLIKFKEAYDNTLSESEKQVKNLENLNREIDDLKEELGEKEGIITALCASTGETVDNVKKYVKMAKGLVDDNTTMDDALSQVLSLVNNDKNSDERQKSFPTSKPLQDSVNFDDTDENPFKTDNLTKQGELIKKDISKARDMYKLVHGKFPIW